MKLNKNGWGTTEMIMISIILLLALIVSIFFISRLYGSFDNSNSNKIYNDLEIKLADASRKYVRDYNIEVVDNYRISYELLRENGYIGELKDADNNSCNGYALITKLNNKKYYHGYITCNNYTSKDY